MTASKPDRRRNAYRQDLAALNLKGIVDAPTYKEGQKRQVVTPSLPMRREPRFDAPLETEALRGETLHVYDEQEGWAWAQLDRDQYVGYVPADRLSAQHFTPTHKISVRRTFLFPGPDIKTPPVSALSLNAQFEAVNELEKFYQAKLGGYIFKDHARPVDDYEPDFVTVAEGFIGTPYLWGGRSGQGIDCSGLVQIAHEACGIPCPRDSDMQEKEIGEPVPLNNLSALKRGDLIFWKGHVGIIADTGQLLHANAHHMLCVSEPLDEAVRRIAETGDKPTSVKRRTL